MYVMLHAALYQHLLDCLLSVKPPIDPSADTADCHWRPQQVPHQWAGCARKVGVSSNHGAVEDR